MSQTKSPIAKTAPAAKIALTTKIYRVGMLVGAASFISACTSFSSQPDRALATIDTASVVKPPVIALVLGGGGAKGFAHVGVIQALEAQGIQPDLVVGTSVGSFVGALYASGQDAATLEQLALSTPDSELTDFTFSHQGVIEGNKLRQFVNAQVHHQSIEDFPIRFAAVAAEKHSLKKAVFTTGEAGLMVQASSSVPNIFIAPRIPETGGKKYIDGGVVSMVPVDTAKDLGADIIIAVDVMGLADSNSVTGSETSSSEQNSSETHSNDVIAAANIAKLAKQLSIWTLIDRAYALHNGDNGNANNKGNNVANDENRLGSQGKYRQVQGDGKPMQVEVNRADIVIRPNVDFVGTFDTSRRQEAIAAGVTATEQSLPAIRAAIAKATLAKAPAK